MVSRGQFLLLYNPTHDVHMSYIAANGIPWMTLTNICSYSWCPQVIYCRQWYPVDDFYCYIIPLMMSTVLILQPMVSRGQLLLLYCSQYNPVDDFYSYIADNGTPLTTSIAILQPMVSHGWLLLLYCSHWYPVDNFYCYMIPLMMSTCHILQPMVSHGWLLLIYDPIHDVHRSYIADNGIPWTTSTAVLQLM